MDDVLANTHKKLVNIVLEEFNTDLFEHDFATQSFQQVLHPKQQQKLYNRIKTKGFFRDVEVMPGAVETVKRLSDYYDVFVATACMEFPDSFNDKFEWLTEHFPFIPWTNIIFCGHKHILSTDFLVDDHPRNLINFKGKGILFTASHNLSEHRFQRVDSWSEVSELFLY
jgi:5'(3')-deoxyribonucleotidase